MIKKFLQYINEADEFEAEVEKSETDESESSKFVEIKDELKRMIEETIEKDKVDYNGFVKSFLRNPKDVKIKGLTSSSDLYEFYIKWRNDIDEILSDINFFDESPSDSNSFGLYDYTINGTQKAIQEFLKTK